MSQPLHTVRILTLNLWAQHGQWDARRFVLRNGLSALNPHLLVFQESIKRDDYDQVIDLLGTNYAAVHHIGNDAEGAGAAIVSRWPFVEVREANLHVTSRV